MGKRTGRPRGRPPGAKSKATIERELRAASGLQSALTDGVLPLDVLLKVMRGGAEAEGISDRQFLAAKEAAPYVHPRLAATTLNATVRRDPADLTDDELAAIAAGSGAGVAEAEDAAPVTH